MKVLVSDRRLNVPRRSVRRSVRPLRAKKRCVNTAEDVCAIGLREPVPEVFKPDGSVRVSGCQQGGCAFSANHNQRMLASRTLGRLG